MLTISYSFRIIINLFNNKLILNMIYYYEDKLINFCIIFIIIFILVLRKIIIYNYNFIIFNFNLLSPFVIYGNRIANWNFADIDATLVLNRSNNQIQLLYWENRWRPLSSRIVSIRGTKRDSASTIRKCLPTDVLHAHHRWVRLLNLQISQYLTLWFIQCVIIGCCSKQITLQQFVLLMLITWNYQMYIRELHIYFPWLHTPGVERDFWLPRYIAIKLGNKLASVFRLDQWLSLHHKI